MMGKKWNVRQLYGEIKCGVKLSNVIFPNSNNLLFNIVLLLLYFWLMFKFTFLSELGHIFLLFCYFFFYACQILIFQCIIQPGPCLFVFWIYLFHACLCSLPFYLIASYMLVLPACVHYFAHKPQKNWFNLSKNEGEVRGVGLIYRWGLKWRGVSLISMNQSFEIKIYFSKYNWKSNEIV